MFGASIHWITWFLKHICIFITQIFPGDFLYVGAAQVFHCPVFLSAAAKLGANCLWVWAQEYMFARGVDAVHLILDICNTIGYINMHYFALKTMQHNKIQVCI